MAVSMIYLFLKLIFEFTANTNFSTVTRYTPFPHVLFRAVTFNNLLRFIFYVLPAICEPIFVI